MIPDLRSSSRGERTTSKISFYPGHLEQRLMEERAANHWVYEVVQVCWLLSRKDLVLEVLEESILNNNTGGCLFQTFSFVC